MLDVTQEMVKYLTI